jgi:hypothetical protein
MPFTPISLRKGNLKERTESGAIKSPKSAREGIVCMPLIMKNKGFCSLSIQCTFGEKSDTFGWLLISLKNNLLGKEDFSEGFVLSETGFKDMYLLRQQLCS